MRAVWTIHATLLTDGKRNSVTVLKSKVGPAVFSSKAKLNSVPSESFPQLLL